MTMKIFLTEMTKDRKTFAGPNIVAENWEEAEAAAECNNLKLLGEFKEIFVKNELMSYLDEELSDRVLH